MKEIKQSSILRVVGKKKIRAGDLRHLIQFFDSEKIPDDYVGFTLDVDPITKAWAKVIVNSLDVVKGDDEKEDGSVFIVRCVELENPPDKSMLILHQDNFYQIVGYSEVGNKAEFYAIACLVQGAVSKLDVTTENETGEVEPVSGSEEFWPDGF